jgi:hypothetical protein
MTIQPAFWERSYTERPRVIGATRVRNARDASATNTRACIARCRGRIDRAHR